MVLRANRFTALRYSFFATFFLDACAEHARNYMENEYEPQLIALIQKSTLADWNYKTNITNENALLSVRNRFFIVD